MSLYAIDHTQNPPILVKITNLQGSLILTQIGNKLTNYSIVTSSSASDSKKQILQTFCYHFNNFEIIGISIKDGSIKFSHILPFKTSDQYAVKWEMAFDGNNIYQSGMVRDKFHQSATKSIWKVNVDTKEQVEINQINVCPSGWFSPIGAVNTDKNLLYLLDEPAIPDGCQNANYIIDLKTNKLINTICSDPVSIMTQVYDSKLKRMFGVCQSMEETLEQYSCYWNEDGHINLLIELTRDMIMANIATISVEDRIAFVVIHNPGELTAISLDSGEILQRTKLPDKALTMQFIDLNVPEKTIANLDKLGVQSDDEGVNRKDDPKAFFEGQTELNSKVVLGWVLGRKGRTHEESKIY